MIETIRTIPRNPRQELRIEIVRKYPAAYIQTRLWEASRDGEMRPRPGSPGIAAEHADEVISAMREAASRLLPR